MFIIFFGLEAASIDHWDWRARVWAKRAASAPGGLLDILDFRLSVHLLRYQCLFIVYSTYSNKPALTGSLQKTNQTHLVFSLILLCTYYGRHCWHLLQRRPMSLFPENSDFFAHARARRFSSVDQEIPIVAFLHCRSPPLACCSAALPPLTGAGRRTRPDNADALVPPVQRATSAPKMAAAISLILPRRTNRHLSQARTLQAVVGGLSGFFAANVAAKLSPPCLSATRRGALRRCVWQRERFTSRMQATGTLSILRLCTALRCWRDGGGGDLVQVPHLSTHQPNQSSFFWCFCLRCHSRR